MRAGPVDLAARRTGLEALLRFKDKGGHLVPYTFARSVDQRTVASKATAEKAGEAVSSGNGEYLSDLFLNLLALEENELLDASLHKETCITGEQNPVFCT